MRSDLGLADRSAAYCRARHAEARADSKVLLAPSLRAGYRRGDAGDTGLGATADQQQISVGLEIAPTNFFVAQALRERAQADCRLEAAEEGINEIADELTATSRSIALARKAQLLDQRLATARAVQARFARALALGTTTLEEKLTVDRTIAEMTAARADALRRAATERARLTGQPSRAFGKLLAEYVEAHGDAAAADNALRRARALTLSLYADAYANFDNKAPVGIPTSDDLGNPGTRVGVRGTYSLGTLFVGGDEAEIVAAKKEAAARKLRGAAQGLLIVARTIAAEQAELRASARLLKAERARTLKVVADLERAVTERGRRMADAVRLQADVYDAEIAYFETLDAEYGKLAGLVSEARGG